MQKRQKSLGTNRSGNGVFINQMGLIVTMDTHCRSRANLDQILTNGETVLADTIVYDYESGLALLKPLKKISIPTIAYQIVIQGNYGDGELCWQGLVV